MNQDLKTFLISIGTSTATMLIGFYINNRLTKKQAINDKVDREQTDRLDPDKNVLRGFVDGKAMGWPRSYNQWRINPFWITFEEHTNRPVLRAWDKLNLEQTIQTGTDGMGGFTSREVSLQVETVGRAQERREWIVFTEENDHTIRFVRTEPFQPADAFLFQPLPL